MVSETLSRADSEFQQGNFDVAATLYAEAVAAFDHDSDDPKNLAILIQKLADSEYAQNKFELARDSYARLVALQEAEGYSEKDKVSAFLKLAKSADKCQSHEEAAKNFQIAYDSLSALSATHFLRRSVVDAYADYLRGTGDNPELLGQLEEELGIKKTDAAAELVIDEVTPESIPTPVTPKPAGEQEFFVLKTRLGKFSRKKEAEVEPEDKAPTLLDKKTDKTIEQEVAERKFLRKGEKEKGAKRTNQRSSLRNVMSKDRGAKSADGDALTNQPDVAEQQQEPAARGAEFDASPPHKKLPAIIEFSPAEERSLAERGIHPSSLPEELYPTASQSNLDADIPKGEHEYFLQDHDLAKFVGRRPKRTLRETGSTTRITAPSLAVEAVSMPEATRSFLQQADAVKKSSDVADVAPDVVPLRAEGRVETVVPASQKLISTLKHVSPILGLLLMAGAAFYFFKDLSPTRPAGAIPSFVVDLVGHKFVTSDGALSITVERTKVNLNGSVNREAKLKIWNGDWRDELALMQGNLKNSRWLIVKPEGLKDENGGTFYALDAPERKTIFYSKEVAEAAQKYFADNKKFPSYASDLGSLSSYTDPYTGKASALAVSSTVDTKRVDSKSNSPLDTQLQSGGWFKGEVAGSPGAVHAFSVSGQPTYSEADNTYSWAMQCFYIHAFDRNHNLIDGSQKNTVFLLTDKNGAIISPVTPDLTKDYSSSDICLSQSEAPKSDGIIFKYMAILIGILLLIGFVMISSRMKKYR